MTSKRIAVAMIGLITIFCLGAPAQTKFKFKEILQTGDDAPVPSLLSFVEQFSLNDQGQIAFIGDGGLFLKSGSDVKLIVAFGDPSPSGGTFVQAESPSINNKGQIVFVGIVSSGSSGLFLFSQGKITLLVPDLSVSTTGDVVLGSEPIINDSGLVVFLNNAVPGFFEGEGLFTFSNGVITKVGAVGDTAPDGEPFTGFDQPAMNSTGQIVFRATLQQTSPFSFSEGVFLASGGTISKIIESGDPVNGSTFFSVSGEPSINDAGQLAFAGFVNGSVSDEGVYLLSGGSLSVVVPTFSSGPGGIFLEPLNAAINNAGQIAFESQTLGSGTGAGVFLLSDNTISQLMLSGQSSPDGDTFSPSGAFGLAINSTGQVLFAGRLLQHTDALYLASGSQLVRIAGQGDAVNRDPKFVFPFAFGISNQDQALVFDTTFPGGTGFYTMDRTPPGKGTLDAHVSQSVGSDGVIEDFFNSFVMNGQGQVIVTADLSDGVSSLLLKSGNSLSEVVRASFFSNGDPAPGGGTFNFIGQSFINNLGQIAFSGGTSNNFGLYLVSNGQTTFVVDGNSTTPDGTGTFGTITFVALNDHGDIVFQAESFPTPNANYLLSNGQFTTLARDGDPAPGGGFFSLAFLDPRLSPVISNNGTVAFAAGLSTGGRGIFLFSQGTLSQIVAPGDPSPDGSTFFSADNLTINSSGQIAFTGQTGNGFGVFLYSGGVIEKVAVPGDRLGKLTLEFADFPQVNDRGHVAFGGSFSNGTTEIVIARPIEEGGQDPTETIAQSGAPDPATPHSLAQARARHLNSFKRLRANPQH